MKVMSVPFAAQVMCAVHSGIYDEIHDRFGPPSDSSTMNSPESGRLWLRLEDGREITVTYQINVRNPAQDAKTEIM